MQAGSRVDRTGPLKSLLEATSSALNFKQSPSMTEQTADRYQFQ